MFIKFLKKIGRLRKYFSGRIARCGLEHKATARQTARKFGVSKSNI